MSSEEKSPLHEFPIHKAIEGGNISEVKKMLEYYPDHINKPDKQNISPLMMCSKLGHVHIAKVLIEHCCFSHQYYISCNTATIRSLSPTK